MRSLVNEKDSVSTKQKNEWAEIYGNMKRETDGLKRDIRLLNKENEFQSTNLFPCGSHHLLLND